MDVDLSITDERSTPYAAGEATKKRRPDLRRRERSKKPSAVENAEGRDINKMSAAIRWSFPFLLFRRNKRKIQPRM